MYKVIEVAKLFSVSKVTIYKKLSAKKVELKGHVTKKKNITYLDDTALEIIKKSLQSNVDKPSGRLIDEEIDRLVIEKEKLLSENEKAKAEQISILNDQLSVLESSIRYLKSQIQIKESHLKSKEEVLSGFKDNLKLNKARIRVLDEIIREFEESTNVK